ncbi:PTS system, lactose/cellobiose family IIC component [Enterobacteriaceae bacterium strain FGI 57]|nr:PTS system, lactose/cellobiose family IIC component [Enterobacteriaceae bacterium strain FGI 57]
MINLTRQAALGVLVDKLTNAAGKFSAQRHLSVVRESFIMLMPLIIASSFFILINNVILHPQTGLVAWLQLQGEWINALREISLRVYNGTLNILSFMATIMIAYKLAKSYDEEGILFAILALAVLITLFPLKVTVLSGSGQSISADGLISSAHTGATGMFVGILVAIISTEIFRRLNKIKKLMISMPESVPPAVTKSFNVMIPIIITLAIFATFGWGCDYFFNRDLYEIVDWLIQSPLQNILQGITGVIALLFTQNGLWWLGIHGTSIMYPITETTLLVAIQENGTALANNLPLPHIVTKPFLDAFGFMGGGGQTVGLLIALLICAKRKDNRIISKIAAPATLFNINEPLIFGLPIMFNPVLIIPFLLTPIASITIAYTATALGLISKTSVLIPWTTPPIISAFLATSGDWRAAVLAALLIVLSVVIYLPFVLIMNHQPVNTEN